MSAVNPYSPPEADVADVAPSAFSTPRIWSWRGRIGRLRFVAYATGGYLAVACGAGLLAGIAGSPAVVRMFMPLLLLAYAVQYALAAIQRSHDMGWRGWTAIALVIPLLNLVWVFGPGTAGANRFGEPPPPNGLGVKLLAAVLPLVMVIGFVAALALPRGVLLQGG